MHKPVFLAALSLMALAIAGLSYGPAFGADQTIDTGNVYFCSSEYENGTCETSINAGDTITWVVSAGFHTVTECNSTHSSCGGAGRFDSGQVEEGDVFSYTFNSVGDFYYYCAFHPTQMTGVVRVAAAPTPTPSPAPTGGATNPPASTPAATVGAVPQTGGAPGEQAFDLATYALLAGGVLLLGMSGLAYARARRD